MDMNAPRPIKRRRVETPDTSPVSRILATPLSLNAEEARLHEPSSLQLTQAAITTKDAWRAAKAWKQAEQKARSAARSHGPPDDLGGVNGKTPVSAKKTGPGRSTKVQLDPLRNQKAAQASSTPVKAGSSLGFFKQFHSPSKAGPAVEGKADTPQEGTEKDDDTGHPSVRSDDVGSAPEVEAAETEASSLATAAPQSSHGNLAQRPFQSNGTPPSTHPRRGTWQYGTKKTFEDEIKELETAARRNAQTEGQDGSPAATVQNRKRTARKDVDLSSAIDSLSGIPAKVSRVKPAVKRKANRANHADKATDSAATNQHTMEVEMEGSDGLSVTTSVKQPLSSTKPAIQDLFTLQHQPPEYTVEVHHARLLQTILLQRITGKRPIPLVNLDGEHAKLFTLITQTVTAGESNSLLVIGARGSGKTALVDQVLREHQCKYADDFLVVRLSGFVHTDDKLALREIWRQLGREMELDEGDGATRNYADTLTSLLALLSTPAEPGHEQAQEQSDQVPKSVIFVLDEFELFASHPRQTLLYNLFDIAQSRKAPIAVLGLTTRVDVVESLEKRVKSRFSHRYVHLSLAKNFSAWLDICRTALCVQIDELRAEETERLKSGALQLDELFKLTATWNATIDSLLASDVMGGHLRRLYYTTKSPPELLTFLLTPVATMSFASPITNAPPLNHLLTTVATPSLAPPNSKLDLLPSLNTLQLALLISAARLSAIHGSDSATFALVYAEYKALASKAKLQASASGAVAQGGNAGRVSGKEVAKQAWEDLVESGLVIKGDGRAGGAGRVDVGLEEIGAYGRVELGGWGRWCKEI